MDDNKENKLYKIVVPVYPVVERSHAKVLEESGFLNKDGYLDVLALIHSANQVERKYQLKITIGCAVIGVLAGLALKFLI